MATFSELVSGHKNVYFTERFELIFNNLVSIRHISISDGDDICTNTHKSGLIEMVGQSAADILQCSNTNSISQQLTGSLQVGYNCHTYILLYIQLPMKGEKAQ